MKINIIIIIILSSFHALSKCFVQNLKKLTYISHILIIHYNTNKSLK